jgi:hypothetical protein
MTEPRKTQPRIDWAPNGPNPKGLNPKWTEPEWTQPRKDSTANGFQPGMDSTPKGLNHEGTQPQMDSSPKKHNPDWDWTPNGRNPERDSTSNASQPHMAQFLLQRFSLYRKQNRKLLKMSLHRMNIILIS